MMIGLWVVAEPFVLTVFGLPWSPVILLLMILAPVGLAQSIGMTVGTIYQSKGRTDWMLRWGVVAGLLVILSFVIGLQWGIVGVATAYAVVSVILIYPSFAIPFKLINMPVRDLLSVLSRPFFCSLTMFFSLLGLKYVLPISLSDAMALAILVISGIIIYLIVSWILNREQLLELLGLIKKKSG